VTQFKHARQLPTSQIILVHPASAAHYLLEGRALVCLVRHGQTDWNLIKRLQGRENVPLNENGHDQARLVSTVIKNTKKMGVTYAAVCTSPLSRAVATAEYIAASYARTETQHGKGHAYPEKVERDYGELSGLTLDERKKLFPGGERQASDVETVPQAAARMLYAIDDMLEVSGRKTVIGVTHGGLINAVFSRLTSGEIGTGKTLTMNCSVSCIAAGIGEPIPLAYNLQNDYAAGYIKKLLWCGAEI